VAFRKETIMPKKHNPIKNLKDYAYPKAGGTRNVAGMAKVVKTSKSKLAKVTQQMKGKGY
jgi:hypothetical protein